MKLLPHKETFEVKTTLDSKEILSRLRDNVDFDHNDKFSTSQVQNDYYGDILMEDYYKIWKTPTISGFMDKGLAPTIEISLDRDILKIKIEDYSFPLSLIISGTMIFIGLVVIIQVYQYEELNGLRYIAGILVFISLIANIIRSLTFNLTTRGVKELMDKLSK